jgi:hypothetical protein
MVDMYQPKLRVEQSADGLYVVHAVTPTPNTCHSAGEPRRTDADGSSIGIPESQEFTLPIERTGGPCGGAITPVRHQFTVLPQPEQSVVAVTVTLDGEEVGSGSITLPAPNESREEPSDDVPRRRSVATPVLGTGEWHAFVDLQPGGNPLFYVEGIVTLSHPGYEVDLVAADEDRKDGRVPLRLTVEERDGVWIQVPVRRSIRYEKADPAKPREIDTAVVELPASDDPIAIDVQAVQ